MKKASRPISEDQSDGLGGGQLVAGRENGPSGQQPPEKRVISIRQRETFFNNQLCHAIFIDDIVEENLLGKKEETLQLHDRIADFTTKKISLPLNLIFESASKLSRKQNEPR